VVLDSSGNLYGLTLNPGGEGAGAYELSLGANGKWTQTALSKIGGYPTGNLTWGANGSLYGASGGAGGTIFELSPSDGEWTLTVLYTFQYNSPGGYDPNGGLIFDAKGNIYGTTYSGGSNDCDQGCGVVFELTP
jgi:hypothetical protein